MEYTVYKRGQITKYEAGVVYRAFKNNEINCLPEFTKWLYDETNAYIGTAIQRYNQDAITYDRVYEITRSILAKDFDKANELIKEIQDRFIRLCGKNHHFTNIKKRKINRRKLKMRNEQVLKVFEVIKQNAEEGNICFSLVNRETGKYLKNSDTGNGWKIFGFSHLTNWGDLIPQHIYGVYGDFLYRLGYEYNQVDNRYNSDEEILDVIEKLLVDWDLKLEETK